MKFIQNLYPISILNITRSTDKYELQEQNGEMNDSHPWVRTCREGWNGTTSNGHESLRKSWVTLGPCIRFPVGPGVVWDKGSCVWVKCGGSVCLVSSLHRPVHNLCDKLSSSCTTHSCTVKRCILVTWSLFIVFLLVGIKQSKITRPDRGSSKREKITGLSDDKSSRNLLEPNFQTPSFPWLLIRFKLVSDRVMGTFNGNIQVFRRIVVLCFRVSRDLKKKTTPTNNNNNERKNSNQFQQNNLYDFIRSL